MNKVILTGRITRDPEIRYSSAGVAYCRFSIAVDRINTNGGERQADFINCSAFRSTAEFLSRYVKKGNLLLVEGRLQTSSYQASDGTNRTSVDVSCDRVENLTPRQQNVNEIGDQNVMNATPIMPEPRFQEPYKAPSYNSTDDIPDMPIDDDDLPF